MAVSRFTCEWIYLNSVIFATYIRTYAVVTETLRRQGLESIKKRIRLLIRHQKSHSGHVSTRLSLCAAVLDRHPQLRADGFLDKLFFRRRLTMSLITVDYTLWIMLFEHWTHLLTGEHRYLESYSGRRCDLIDSIGNTSEIVRPIHHPHKFISCVSLPISPLLQTASNRVPTQVPMRAYVLSQHIRQVSLRNL